MVRSVRIHFALLVLMLLATGCGGGSPRSDEHAERPDGEHAVDAGAPLLDAQPPQPTIDGASASDVAPALSADASAQPPDASSEFAAFDRSIRDSLARLVDSDPPVPGAVAIVVHRERGVVHAQGYGNLQPERRFLLGGASMMISAGVLMRLVDRGLVALDAPIAGALSRWGAHKTSLTLAQLLSGSAGLPSMDELRTAEFSDDPGRLTPHMCQRREAGALESCGRAIYEDDTPENNLPPDQRFVSGGSAWQLAGALAEQVSGKPWSELVRETYVEPCAMASLGYTNQYERSPIDYPPFDGDTERLPRTENPSIEGGAYVSATDYAKLLLMQLRGGTCGDVRVLSAASVARMQEDRLARYGGATGSPIASGYGFGFSINARTGVISAPGAYGFYPLLDKRRGYGLLIAIEGDVVITAEIMLLAKRQLDALYPPRD